MVPRSWKEQLASARDRLWPRRCSNKHRYEDEATAMKIIRSRTTSHRDAPAALYQYHCSECGGWHITRMEQP
jgi:hypothetical protein